MCPLFLHFSRDESESRIFGDLRRSICVLQPARSGGTPRNAQSWIGVDTLLHEVIDQGWKLFRIDQRFRGDLRQFDRSASWRVAPRRERFFLPVAQRTRPRVHMFPEFENHPTSPTEV